MRILKLTIRMPKQIVIPIPIPSMTAILSLIGVVAFSAWTYGMINLGYSSGYLKGSVDTHDIDTRKVDEASNDTDDVNTLRNTTKFINISCGDDIVINGCGWIYLGRLNTLNCRGVYVLGRSDADDVECGGEIWSDLETRFIQNHSMQKWRDSGMKRFMFIIDPSF